jgi:hypothetical protein
MATSSETAHGMASRWPALSGAAFVILVLASFSSLGADAAGGNDPVSEITSYYSAHQFFIPYASFFAMVATAVWIIAMSIVLFRGQRAPSFALGAEAA